MAAPLVTMASLLAAPLRNLGYALSQLVDKKGAEAGPAVSEEPKAEAPEAQAPEPEAPAAEATEAQAPEAQAPEAEATDAEAPAAEGEPTQN